MRVLHVITDLYTGGAERALYNLLANGLSERYETHVFSLREETDLSRKIDALGVPVYSAGMVSGLTLTGVIWRLRNEIMRFRPSVVQGWMYHGNLIASVATAISNQHPMLSWNIRQTLYTLDNEKPLTRQVIRANRAMSGYPGMILYNSAVSREQHEKFGFSPQSARVIPNGINLIEYFPSAPVKSKVRLEVGIREKSRVIGHVARFHPMKNHKGFIRAAVQIADQFDDVDFMLVGRDVSEDNGALMDLVPDAHRSRFHLLNEQNDIPELMKAMDIFCLSSSYGEAFPNVLGEAMATELPCVTTDVGDCADILGDTGIVVPAREGDALKSALEKMLKMSVVQLRDMGARARKRVQSHYDMQIAVTRYGDLYADMADKK